MTAAKIDLSIVQNEISSLSVKLTDIINLRNSRDPQQLTVEEFNKVLAINSKVTHLLMNVIGDYPAKYERALIDIGNIPRGNFSRYGEPFDSYVYAVMVLSHIVGQP